MTIDALKIIQRKAIIIEHNKVNYRDFVKSLIFMNIVKHQKK